MLLEIKNLHFSYSPEKKLFNNLNLNIGKGKIVALAGESGCGKSTLLNLIYGLIDWQQGEILLDGKKLFGPKGNIVPGENEMKFVAQNYDLMPYSSVYDNVGKFISNINLKEKRERVLELLKVVGMENFADVKPKYLSGGQQQRVAIARALSVLPKLLLLDEPFSNLDFPRKIELRERLFSFAKQHEITIIISTHEIQEIMPWLEQIIILQDGRLIQNDSPEETYKNPYNEYVARLFGEVNVLTDEQKSSLNTERNFIYPNEIILSEKSDETKSAIVLESRFAGNHYWNKIAVNEMELIIYTNHQLNDVVEIKIL
ncbi:MAG: ABC transporter ATP-binding protein [Cruoricaptor ignavus]|nr:ABC transporter ATP-binding protein [Cruoricaptor ignavus]